MPSIHLLLFSSMLSAADFEWIGNQNQRWRIDDNWRPDGDPGTSDKVIFDYAEAQRTSLNLANSSGNATDRSVGSAEFQFSPGTIDPWVFDQGDLRIFDFIDPISSSTGIGQDFVTAQGTIEAADSLLYIGSTHRSSGTRTSVFNVDGSFNASGVVEIRAGSGLSLSGTQSGLTGTVRLGFPGVTAFASSLFLVSGANTAQNVSVDVDFGEFQLNGTSTTFNVGELEGSGGIVNLGDNTLSVGAKNSGNKNYGGVITGSGNLTKVGSSQLTLSGANTFTGTTSINGGTLRLTNPDALQNSTLNLSSNNSVVFVTSTDENHFRGITGSGNLNAGNESVFIDGNASGNYTGILSGTGTLNVTNKFTIGGSGNVTMPINVTGTLVLDTSTPVTGLQNLTFGSTADLEVNSGTQTVDIRNWTSENRLTLGASAELILDSGSNDIQFYPFELIDFSSTIRKKGTGNITYRLTTGSPTGGFFEIGSFILEGGTFRINSDAAGTSQVGFGEFSNGGSIEIDVGAGNDLVFGFNSFTGTGDIHFQSGNIEFAGFGDTPPGNTYSGGTQIDADAHVTVTNYPEFFGTGVTQFNGGILTIDSNVITSINNGSFDTLNGNPVNLNIDDSNHTVTDSRNNTFTGNFNLGGQGTYRVTGTLDPSGTTTISADATLEIGDGGTTGTFTDAVTNNGTFILNRSNFLGYDSDITGTGSVIKRGSGITRLIGNNTYTGTTIVEAGTLRLNSATAAGTGTFTVKSGATLDGSGTVPSLIVESGGTLSGNLTSANTGDDDVNGTLSPGDSIGTMTFDGSVLLSTGRYVAEIDGTTSDFVDIAELLQLFETTIEFSEIGSGATEPYYAVAEANSTTFNPSVEGVPSGYTFSSQYVLPSNRRALAIYTGTGPNVIAITPNASNPTDTQISFGIVFDRPVRDFDRPDDLLPITTGTLNASYVSLVSNDDNAGFSFTATYNVAGEGTMTLAANLQSTVRPLTDGVGQTLVSTVTSSGVTIDNVAPILTTFAITASESDPTNDDSITFDVVFSEDVENVDSADFSITSSTGDVSGSIGTPSGSGDTYTVTVTSVTGDGDLVFSFSGAEDITDTVGNEFDGASATASVSVDNTGPTATLSTLTTPDPTAADTVAFNVSFDQSVPALVASDIAVSFDGTSVGAEQIADDGDGTSWTVTIPNIVGSGTLSLDIEGSNSITDAVGNGLENDPAAASIVIDQTGPVPTITAVTSSPTSSDTAVFSLTFDGPVLNLDVDDLDFTFAGSTDDPVLSGTTSPYTVTFNNVSGNGDLTLFFDPANDITDALGNALQASGVDATVAILQIAIWQGNGTSSSNWETSANWLNDVLPNADLIAEFGSISIPDNTISLSSNQSVKTLNIDGTTEYTFNGTSTLTVSSGEIIIGSSGALNQHTINVPLDLGPSGILDLSEDLILGNTISTNTALTKRGSSTLFINTDQSHTGGTIIEAGMLDIGSNSLGSSGIVEVDSGAVLTGSGSTLPELQVRSGGSITGTHTITGNADIDGTLSPGLSSPGAEFSSMTFLGDVDLRNATYIFDIDGASSDNIDVSGSLQLQGLTIQIQELNAGATLSFYPIASYGTRGGNPLAVNGISPGYVFSDSYVIPNAPLALALVSTTGPAVTSITPLQSSPTSASQLSFEVVFDRPVRRFESGADFNTTLTGDLSVSFNSIVDDSGDGTTFTVTYGVISGNGSLAIQVVSGAGAGALIDGINQTLSSSVTSDPITVDQVPTLTTFAIASSETNPSNEDSITFDVVFSEDVQNVDSADFSIANSTGTISGSIGTPAGSGDTYTVTVGSVTGDGDLVLSFSGAEDIIDAMGNEFDSTAASVTITIDNTAPVIVLSGSEVINLPINSVYTEPGAIANDAVDGSFAATVGGDTVDTSVTGSYTVTYDATDTVGNVAVMVSRTVNVFNVISSEIADWAHESGLTPGLNDALSDDPNSDGILNIEHFAFNTDPLSSSYQVSPIRSAMSSDAGGDFLTLTLPVRSDANFSGSSSLSASASGIIYTILGGNDLPPSGLVINELRTALDTGLPALDKGWEYRSFRIEATTSVEPRVFMQIKVEEDL